MAATSLPKVAVFLPGENDWGSPRGVIVLYFAIVDSFNDHFMKASVSSRDSGSTLLACSFESGITSTLELRLGLGRKH